MAAAQTPNPQDLLAWYDRHRRRLPWRALPGETADPYAVWLSEIMLQQTTVTAVKPYFVRFLSRWPTVEALAAAGLDDVLTEWAGLGYYARARNLHACAKVVAEKHDGVFPKTEDALLALPGIGAYTAAAITAIAFGRKAVVVDGNVERVMARVYAVEEPLPKAKASLKALAAELTQDHRPGDYAQAVMDLGATVCTPKSPSCVLCPWQEPCRARHLGIASDLPRRAPKKERPTRRGVCFWLTRSDGAILLRRRPEKGLLGGMMEIPSTPWHNDQWAMDIAKTHAPVSVAPTKWRSLDGIVMHTFTHFHLELEVEAALITDKRAGAVGGEKDFVWAHLDALGDQALPSVMRKVVKHALKVGY
ncbi:MAG: A/G-specific adenine glycosylase [Rhodospirillaceae bacterium]|jgi:A/G-specific adenine glycosylase|nr:A/G-specific adenine glycosylase [Rhodospirillaceae bacterium]MBT5241210.1 A/G-specific adenine glycosylase [Rhodospirillaceae bacterium]MBT5565155.1 A/G-specific adenine glycosylase [Rhodospirillaceae bacterium]MBT6088177.1 A/G-specific adenine glycosylase [Rhodospirillaceae bacterium]MBT6960954.1 A/G-specific adenine glycosylase [Rhodospirillaceae bacterium]